MAHQNWHKYCFWCAILEFIWEIFYLSFGISKQNWKTLSFQMTHVALSAQLFCLFCQIVCTFLVPNECPQSALSLQRWIVLCSLNKYNWIQLFPVQTSLRNHVTFLMFVWHSICTNFTIKCFWWRWNNYWNSCIALANKIM